MPSRLLAPPARQEFLPKSFINRRVAVRHPASASVSTRLTRDTARARRATIRDISVSGLALIVRSPLKAGTDLLVQMKNEALDLAYDLAARVIHATSQPRGRWIIGCAFARELTPSELETLL